MADQLATPTDLAALVQADVDTASATLAIEIGTAVVQAAAGQRIVRVADDQVTVYGGTDQVLVLPERPIVSVASVTYNGTALTQGTSSGTWRMAAEGLWRSCGWTDCPGEPWPTVVVYTHGLTTSDQDIQLGRGVALSLGRGLFISPTGQVIREQIDDYAVAYAEAAEALDAKPSLISLLRAKYGRKAGMVRVL